MKIFVINLDNQPDRYKNILEQLQHIPFERVSPVPLNNKELLNLAESHYRPYLCELSLQLTVRNILKSNIRANSPILILEDDIDIDSLAHFEFMLNKIQSLPKTFQLAFLGLYFRPDKKTQLKKYDENWYQFTDTVFYGCHAVVYNPKNCKDIIRDFTKKKQLPIDGYHYMKTTWYNNCYVATNLNVWQKQFPYGIHGDFPFEELKSDSLRLYAKWKD